MQSPHRHAAADQFALDDAQTVQLARVEGPPRQFLIV
jgi:hypothetical protein